jgi:ArsR family transcriptional regulator, arsenate/arsenite/antimonite-responsive transcriptional repressor
VATTKARTSAVDDMCCPPLREAVLDEAAATALAPAFAALADPARLRLLSLIASAPAGEACACDLIAPIGKSQPTVSHHLKVLVDAGLIQREKRGVWAWYRANPQKLSDLRSVLG